MSWEHSFSFESEASCGQVRTMSCIRTAQGDGPLATTCELLPRGSVIVFFLRAYCNRITCRLQWQLCALFHTESEAGIARQDSATASGSGDSNRLSGRRERYV